LRYSKLFIPTVKEDPADAEVVSHRLMLRAGMIRKVAAGVYNLLPVGLRVIRNVERIVREEMNRAGAQEVQMPVVQPAELWLESGRWDKYGKELLRVRDRHDRDFCLGPTHEEIVTNIVRHEIRSYRQLPVNLYQIHTKFRDEIRPRFGMMRGREFTMKDAYSFDVDDDASAESYKQMFAAYERIFTRCGLDFAAVEADTGAIGGSFSHEFMVLADTGEDEIIRCTKCGYAANVEKAEVAAPGEAAAGEGGEPYEKVETPGKKAAEEVAEFLLETVTKTMVFETEKGLVAAVVRGDHEVNPLKLKTLLGVDLVALAAEPDVAKAAGAHTGSLGPVGLGIDVYADYAVQGLVGGHVCGANEDGLHLRHVRHGRDWTPKAWGDIRMIRADDPCPKCEGAIELRRGIEVGHVFRLGTKYSEAMRATYLDAGGAEQHMVMGCYGIGIGRTAAAAIEQNHDEAGIRWPAALAPFHVHIVPVSMRNEEVVAAAELLHDALEGKGVDVLLDDRDERAGVKFKDADLVGCPWRVTIGPKTLPDGKVELKTRIAEKPELVDLEGLDRRLADEVHAALSAKA